MKINELLKKRPTLSFEIFPPKNNENDITSIYATIDELAKMNPDFISVTYGANGSTSKNTCKIASTIKNKYGIESVAHLTCMNNTKEEIKVNDETLEEPVISEPEKDVLEDFEPKQDIKLSTYDELEHLEDEKYNLSKKDYNDRLAILLNQINVSELKDQDEIDKYLIHLSLIEGDSLIYKNNNKLISKLIEELNNNSEYMMESDEVDDDTITLTDKDIDIDDLNIIDINDLVNNKSVLNEQIEPNDDEFDKLEDVEDLVDTQNDKVYLDESDLDIDDDLDIIENKDNNDLLADTYFDDLIDDATIDSLLNDLNTKED